MESMLADRPAYAATEQPKAVSRVQAAMEALDEQIKVIGKICIDLEGRLRDVLGPTAPQGNQAELRNGSPPPTHLADRINRAANYLAECRGSLIDILNRVEL